MEDSPGACTLFHFSRVSHTNLRRQTRPSNTEDIKLIGTTLFGLIRYTSFCHLLEFIEGNPGNESKDIKTRLPVVVIGKR